MKGIFTFKCKMWFQMDLNQRFYRTHVRVAYKDLNSLHSHKFQLNKNLRVSYLCINKLAKP